jgi:hypothetical protein
MANEGNYNFISGEGYNQFIANKEANQKKKQLYLESEEFKTKTQNKLNKLEEFLTSKGYKKLEPGSKLEKDKIYYILQKLHPEFEEVNPIKVKCIAVNPDGSGNFKGFAKSSAVSPTRYNNISIVGDNKEFFGIWNRPASLNTVFGIGSATKYRAGKKSRKSKKSRRTKRTKRKARKTRRH